MRMLILGIFNSLSNKSVVGFILYGSLPGNPASAFVCAQLFLRTLMVKTAGPANVFEAELGPVDLALLGAGMYVPFDIRNIDAEGFRQTMALNVDGVLNGVASVMPTFTEQKSGYVLAVSSVAGLKNYPGASVYGGTKWFVRNFMEVLRMEAAMEGSNIRTSTLYPAAISTELLDTITDQQTATGMQGLYDAMAITPDRIADVVAFALDLPEDTTVSEFTVGPARQPW